MGQAGEGDLPRSAPGPAIRCTAVWRFHEAGDRPDDPRLCFTKAIPGSSTRNRRRNPAMTSPRLTGPSETTITQDLLYAGRSYLGCRRGLLLLPPVAIRAGPAPPRCVGRET